MDLLKVKELFGRAEDIQRPEEPTVLTSEEQQEVLEECNNQAECRTAVNDVPENDCTCENPSENQTEESIKEEDVEISSSNEDVIGKQEPVPAPSCIENSAQIEEINQRVSSMQEVMDNLLFNVQILVQNQSTANDVAVMRRENEAFRSDSNIKMMRAYGIDAMIKMYQAICDKLFLINHPDTSADIAKGEIEKNVYVWMQKKLDLQFKRLGIKLYRSETGDDVNEEFMEIYGSNGEDVDEELTMVATENPDLKDTVKESVCPAFIWTIPTLNGSQKEWVMEHEKICMYK